MKPNPELVKILNSHNCKLAYKQSGKDHFYIHVDYTKSIEDNKKKGLMAWGNSQETFDNISITIRRYHPNCELTSQNGIGSAVWRIGGQSFNN
jgi:hypothetical protein